MSYCFYSKLILFVWVVHTVVQNGRAELKRAKTEIKLFRDTIEDVKRKQNNNFNEQRQSVYLLERLTDLMEEKTKRVNGKVVPIIVDTGFDPHNPINLPGNRQYSFGDTEENTNDNVDRNNAYRKRHRQKQKKVKHVTGSKKNAKQNFIDNLGELAAYTKKPTDFSNKSLKKLLSYLEVGLKIADEKRKIEYSNKSKKDKISSQIDSRWKSWYNRFKKFIGKVRKLFYNKKENNNNVVSQKQDRIEPSKSSEKDTNTPNNISDQSDGKTSANESNEEVIENSANDSNEIDSEKPHDKNSDNESYKQTNQVSEYQDDKIPEVNEKHDQSDTNVYPKFQSAKNIETIKNLPYLGNKLYEDHHVKSVFDHIWEMIKKNEG